MGFKCGIVGLPNVGKSTLFNALTAKQSAEAANYPFCTIEPNTALVEVPDERLSNLANLCKSEKIIPTQIEFVDIAGLVKGASKGEGLGNQFLSHIREVDAIVHVLRCFEDSDVTHVEGSVDPLRDAEIIETELVLADLESIEKRLENLNKKARLADKEGLEFIEFVKQIYAILSEGKPARVFKVNSEEEKKQLKNLQLITSKPIMYVCNINESDVADGNEFSKKVVAKANAENAKVINISCQIEAEISCLSSEEEKQEFMSDLGLKTTGLSRIIREGHDLLDLISFFTVGPKEARAWTLTRTSKAPKAAGVIHTDFEKGFIRAETIKYEDYITQGSEVKCKETGKLRLEGKEYIVQDGDVIHFRFNV